jgi:hypothetical protein
VIRDIGGITYGSGYRMLVVAGYGLPAFPALPVYAL